MTAGYLFVNMENNTGSYAGAGHPPLLHWRAQTGKTSEYKENGLVVGPFSHSTYSATAFPCERGDRIVLFTDGIVEATDSLGKEFGIDRLKRILESKHDLPASRFADALLYGLSGWSAHAIGTGQTDDLTVLVIGFEDQ